MLYIILYFGEVKSMTGEKINDKNCDIEVVEFPEGSKPRELTLEEKLSYKKYSLMGLNPKEEEKKNE